MSVNRVELKTGDPVTKIASLDVMKWQPDGWPVLRLQYRSYLMEAPGQSAGARHEGYS